MDLKYQNNSETNTQLLLWRCHWLLWIAPDVVPTQEFRQFLDAQHQDVPDYDLLRFLRVTRMAKMDGKKDGKHGKHVTKHGKLVC